MKLIDLMYKNEELCIITYFLKNFKFYRTRCVFQSQHLNNGKVPVYLMGDKQNVIYSSLDGETYYFDPMTEIIPINIGYRFESTQIKMVIRTDTNKLVWYDGKFIF